MWVVTCQFAGNGVEDRVCGLRLWQENVHILAENLIDRSYTLPPPYTPIDRAERMRSNDTQPHAKGVSGDYMGDLDIRGYLIGVFFKGGSY